MLKLRLKRLTWIGIALATGLLLTILGQGIASALSNGSITGRSQQGCAACHGANPSPGVKIAITGPTEVKPGGTYSYTVALSGSPTQGGGLNLSVSQGTLSPGNNSQLVRGELTHIDRQSRSWTFDWTAPAEPGPVEMYVAANAVNADGMPTGDAWNLASLTINVPAPAATPAVGGAVTQPTPGAPAAVPATAVSLTIDTPPSWVAGQPVTLKATLANAQGQPMAGETIDFSTRSDFFIEESVALGQARTDALGQASFTYTPRGGGETTVVAKYPGNRLYGPREVEINFDVASLGSLYQPRAGVSLPLLGPWLLALVIATIWSIYFFVWSQVLKISQE